MRQLGVKYLMVFTPEAVAEAEKQQSLKPVATSGPWRIFEHTDHAIVTPLNMQPVVVNERSGDQRERWLEVGSSYFQHSNEWTALPVADGPEDWQRIDVVADVSRRIGEPGDSGRRVDIVVPSADTEIVPRAIEPVSVTNVEIGRDSVSFSVDKVGVPVLVRVSYFPNWTAHGTADIVRAAPNMMVVVPKTTDVRMSYEGSGLDRWSYVFTLVGIIMLAWCTRRRFRYGTSFTAVTAPETPLAIDADR
jgi:hypothetical protein